MFCIFYYTIFYMFHTKHRTFLTTNFEGKQNESSFMSSPFQDTLTNCVLNAREKSQKTSAYEKIFLVRNSSSIILSARYQEKATTFPLKNYHICL